MSEATPLTAPSGKAWPRCSTCGERTKQHNPDLCESVRQLKEGVKAASKLTIQLAPTLLDQEPSVSQASRRGFRSTTNQSTSIPPENQVLDNTTHSDIRQTDRGIYLSVSSRPNLTTRYQPILEMKFFLELRGLQFSNFHITERGEWAFMVSGSRGQIMDWAAETKASSTLRMVPGQGQSRLQTVVLTVALLCLGLAIGAGAVIYGPMYETV